MKKKILSGLIIGAFVFGVGAANVQHVSADSLDKAQQAKQKYDKAKDKYDKTTEKFDGKTPPEPPKDSDGKPMAPPDRNSDDTNRPEPPKDSNGKPMPPPDRNFNGEHSNK